MPTFRALQAPEIPRKIPGLSDVAQRLAIGVMEQERPRAPIGREEAWGVLQTSPTRIMS